MKTLLDALRRIEHDTRWRYPCRLAAGVHTMVRSFECDPWLTGLVVCFFKCAFQTCLFHSQGFLRFVSSMGTALPQKNELFYRLEWLLRVTIVQCCSAVA